MDIENIQFEDAVIQIPRNTVSLKIEAETYENGEIVKLSANLDFQEVRDALDTFQQTMSGDYPTFRLTESGKAYGEAMA